MRLSFFFGFMLLLSSCAHGPLTQEGEEPKWLRSPDSEYPSDRYLTSVGVGPDRDSAIRDARKNMAESFMVLVKSSSLSASESKMSSDTEGRQSGASKQDLSKEVSVESVARLRGAEIKGVAGYRGETYALLVLDRLKARSGLLLEMELLIKKMESELDNGSDGMSSERWMGLKKDLESLRELSSESLALGVASLSPLDRIETKMRQLDTLNRQRNRDLRFHVRSVKGDERFARNLEVCIQEQGGKVMSENAIKEGGVRVEVSVEEAPGHLEIPGWVKMRYEVSANFIKSNGSSLRVIEESTETARSSRAALEAASRGLIKKVCEQVWNRMGELK